MKFTDIFIRRPVLATVISLLILIVGLASIFTLQLRQYPKITSTTIIVTTAYPGANAKVIQGFLTTPLEQSIGSADGIDYMTSSSATGLSTITIYLKLNWDPEKAMTDITQKINAVKSQLPAAAESSTLTVQSGDSFPALILAFTSKTMNVEQISSYLTNEMTPKLFSLGGISEVNVMGNMKFAMRIWLDPKRMALAGVTPIEISNALQSNSIISSAGSMEGKYQIIDINPNTSMTSAKEYENLVVKNDNGHIIRLRDVATVKLSSEYYNKVKVLFNSKDGVFIGISVAPDANSLSVIDKVIQNIPELKQQLPSGLGMTVVYNSTDFIKASINEVVKTIIEAIIIVILVMLVFLGSFRLVLIPIVTIPLSLIGVFFLMGLMGFSINLLTLLALVLAIGLVVDDAIVVLENIYRHIEEGRTPFQAAIQGAREITGPVIVMTLTLAAVYAPIGMLGGLTGSLFTEFAYTLAATVILSGIIALTLSPMMSAKVMNKKMLSSPIVKFVDNIFARLISIYQKGLHASLLYRPIILLLAVVVFVSCYFMFIGTKSILAPQEDQGFIGVFATAPSSANLNYLKSFIPPLEKISKDLPQTKAYFDIAGYPTQNQFFSGIALKPWDQRDETQMQILPKIQAKLDSIAGIQAYAFQMPPLPGVDSGLPIQFILKSTLGYEQLNTVMNELIAKAKQSGLFLFVTSSLRYDQPQLEINIQKQKAADLGITMQMISNTLQASYAGAYVNYFSMYGYSFKVIPQLEDAYRMNAQQLMDLRIATSSGKLIPLSSIITIKYDTQPSSLDRFQQLNSVMLSAMPVPGASQGDILNYLQNTAQQVMPKGMQTDEAGALRQFVQEGNALFYAFGFAIIIIFLLLAAQFESYRDPFVVLISVPMSICGALIPIYLLSALGIDFATINIYTQIGFITLMGLISKHGILITEFANKLQEEGLSKMEAIKKSATLRLRPILMTTFAMAFGVVPLILSSGAGAESRHSIGVVIFFGMMIGTLFTIFVVPTMYSYIAKDRSILIKQRLAEDEAMIGLDNASID